MRNICLLICLLFFPAIAFAQPSIVFNNVQQDFGTVSKTGALHYTFEFTNAGSEDLIIDKVVPS